MRTTGAAAWAGLRCRCPQCGEGPLFAGFLRVCETCAVCGLDMAAADSGDGPAVFIMLIGGALVVGPAFALQMHYNLSPGVTLAFALPLTLIVCIGLLRPFKALLLAMQFHHKAAESTARDGS